MTLPEIEEPASYNIKTCYGSDYRRTFTWKVSGVVQSLAGVTIRSQVRATKRIDALLLAELTPMWSVDTGANTFSLSIPDDWAGVELGGFLYDVVFDVATDPDGSRKVMEGTFTRSGGVTRL